jgi:hypothetical protein
MSFLDGYNLAWADVIDSCVDVAFGIDMFLTFFTAYYDNNLNLITDRKVLHGLMLENIHELPHGMVHDRHTFYLSIQLADAGKSDQ